MKILLFIYLLCGIGVLASIADGAMSLEDRRKELMLLSLKDSVHREEAVRAWESVQRAKGGVAVEAEMKKMFAIEDPSVKLATLAWSPGSLQTKQRLAKDLRLQPKDLPVVLTWMFLRPGGEHDMLGDWSENAWIYANMDLIANEAVKILGVETDLLKFKPPTPGRLWETYTEDALRSWAIAQIQVSLNTKDWSLADSDLLKGLLEQLKTGSKDFLTPSAAGSKPSPSAPTVAVTSPPVLNEKSASHPQSWRWIIGFALAFGALVLLLLLRRKFSR